MTNTPSQISQDTDDFEEDSEKTITEFKPTWKSQSLGIALAAACGFTIVLLPATVIILVGLYIGLKSMRYRLTNERFIIEKGIFTKRVEEIELYRVKDVVVTQGAFDLIFKTGTLRIMSVDSSTPDVKIRGVDEPQELKEKFRRLYRAARKRERVMNTEIMYQ